MQAVAVRRWAKLASKTFATGNGDQPDKAQSREEFSFRDLRV
jgi:hypothetical protein